MTTIYGTRAELRQRIDTRDNQTWSVTHDALHDAALEAASRAIDDVCGQFFHQTSAESRYFTPSWPDVLVVPPLVSVSELATDETGSGSYSRTWSATDYVLWPHNAASQTPARPYYEIRVDERTSSSGYVFPLAQRSVKLTAVYGWPAVPSVITEVCLLEAQRLLDHMQAPSGVAASQELGQWMVAPQLHPTSVMMLAPYKRAGLRVGHAV